MEPLAVFAVAGITSIADHAKASTTVYPPTGANANLAAQSGVLVKHDWSCRDYWRPDYDHPLVATKVSALLDSRFIRFELPAARARDLIVELEKRGVDGATLFPGMRGFAAVAADFAACVVAHSLREEETPDSDAGGLETA